MQGDFIRGDLSKFTLEDYQKEYGEDFGSVQDFYGRLQTDPQMETGLSDPRYFGRYGDTEIAKVGGEWRHVNPTEYKKLIMDPSFEQTLIDSPYTINTVTGLKEHWIGAAISAIGTGIGWLNQNASGLGLATSALGYVSNAASTAQANKRKIGNIDDTIQALSDKTTELQSDKAESVTDLIDAKNEQLQSLSVSTESALESLSASAQKAERMGKGLKTAAGENLVTEGKETISASVTQTRDQLLRETEEQEKAVVDKLDTQISDVAANVEQLVFEKGELQREDNFWEALNPFN